MMATTRSNVPFASVLAATLALCAAAVQAGDCWVAGVDEGDRIGVAANATLRNKLQRAEQALRGDGAVNAIRDVRYQAHRSIEWESRHPGAPLAAEVNIYLHQPDSWEGKCGLKGYADDVHFAALSVDLNMLGALVALSPGQLDEWDAFIEPPSSGRRDGYPIYGDRVLVLTPAGIAPLAPVSVGEYLDYWERKLVADAENLDEEDDTVAEFRAYIAQLEISDPKLAGEFRATMQDGAQRKMQTQTMNDADLRALRAKRKSLSASQRAEPAYLSSEATDQSRFGYAKAGDHGAQRLVRINPALWRGSNNAQQVRSVTLVVGLSRLDTFDNHDPDPQIDQITDWVKTVDVRPYRELLDQ